MAYGLPSRGQRDWDDELNNSVEALRGTTEATAAVAAVAASDAAYARNRADEVHTAVLGGSDTRYAVPAYGLLADRPDPALNKVYFAHDVSRAYFAVDSGGGYSWESADGADAAKDFGLLGDGTPNDPARVAEAVAAVSVAGRPGVLWFPSHKGPGLYTVTETLEVAENGVVLASPARSDGGSGARLKWAGAAGGTILSVDAARVQLANLGFDGDNLAATLFACTSKKGLQLINFEGRRWTGTGLVLGDGTANMNEFYSQGLHLQGSTPGSVGMVIDSTATELMKFENTLLNCDGGNVGMLRWIESDTNVEFRGLTMDDFSMTDHAIKSNAGFVRVYGASEVPKLIFFASVGRMGMSIIDMNARSLSPGVGEYAAVLQGQGHFHVAGRFQRKAGAAAAPNVQIGSGVLGVVEEGVIWDSADAGAVGTFVTNPDKVLSIARTRGVVDSLKRPACWQVPDHATRTTLAGTLNRCIYVPLRVRKTTTFDRIACEVTTGIATGITRLGLYRSADGLPTTFVYRSANLDSSGTGEVGETFATPVTVEPGLYFVAAVAQVAAPTYRASATYSENLNPASFTGSGATVGIYQTAVSGALPATAAPTLETGTAPIVALRAV